MKYDPSVHHRRSVRLADYDYSGAGAYFVTICTENRVSLFGDVVRGEARLNRFGDIVRQEWTKSSQIRSEIELDEFIVMPNHLHGIVIISVELQGQTDQPDESNVGATGWSPLRSLRAHGPPTRSLSSFVAGYKTAVTKRINEIRGTPRVPVWQHSYYEHVIRSEKSLERLREYIAYNAQKWELDELNPAHPAEYPARSG